LQWCLFVGIIFFDQIFKSVRLMVFGPGLTKLIFGYLYSG
jgi:hypothetical protein